MIKTIKNILQYKLDGIDSVIQIGKADIRFKRKKVLCNALSQYKENIEQLEKQFQIINVYLQKKIEYSFFLEKENSEQRKQIEQLRNLLILKENKYNLRVIEKENEYNVKFAEKETYINLLNDNVKQLKQEKRVFETLVDSKARYVESSWCTGWIMYWRQYFQMNYHKIENKIYIIKQNVDDKSKELIDLLLNRNLNIFPTQEYTEFFLYNREKLFTEWEKEGMNVGMHEEAFREKYHLGPEIYLETPVFEFHCGLTLLPQEIRERIKGKDVIDGGAFWGDSALVIHEYLPSSIHAFEPMPINFMHLCETKEKNNLENLFPIEAGLGEFSSGKKLYYHEMLSGASVVSYKALAYEQPEVHENDITVTTIDEYVLKNNLNVGLIKLDVEGSELESIKGAVNTICQHKPILLIAVYHLPKDLFEIKPFLEGLDLGYQFMFRKLVFHDPLTEVSLIAYVP